MKQLYSGIVYDTMRQLGYKDNEFLLSSRIRPLDLESWCYGPAFTNWGRRTTKKENYEILDAIRLKMYKIIKPGDVIVLQANDDYCAHAGDISCLIYKKVGAIGLITDGIVRDSRRIRELDFPCFCLETNPIDALSYWAITKYQSPIFLPGIDKSTIEINPGDFIYADCDGVIRIPKSKKTKFEKLVFKNLKRENKCRKTFTAIKTPPEAFTAVKKAFEKYGRW